MERLVEPDHRLVGTILLKNHPARRQPQVKLPPIPKLPLNMAAR